MRQYVWSNKQERMKQAQEYTKMVKEKYDTAVAGAENLIFGPNRIYNQAFPQNENMEIIVVDKDSVSAVYKYHEGKTAVFLSATNSVRYVVT